MKKPIDFLVEQNGLKYITNGFAYFKVTHTENHINDDSRNITEVFEDIELEDLILNDVTVLDNEDNTVYEGKSLKRHYAFFEWIVKSAEIDFNKNHINIEIL